MHVAVLGSPGSWYVKDLQRAAAQWCRVTQVTFRDMAARLGMPGAVASSGEHALPQFDALLVRTMAPGTLEQVVFRMDVLGRLEAAGLPVINSARAVETAVDKYLASARLAEAGLLVPPTIVCQTADEALRAFHELGGDVVLKPLFGSEGRGIARLSDEALAQRAFQLLEPLGAVLYLQKFIEHEGCDLRVLLIGQQAWGIRRSNPLDWRTNCSRGALAEPLELSGELIGLARRAADAVGALVAGVDLLPGRDGKLYAIEVNAVPGWRALAGTLNVDIARAMLEYVREQIEREQASRLARQ